MITFIHRILHPGRALAMEQDAEHRQAIRERLEATLKPNVRYAYNRAAQLPPERRERFLKAVGLDQ